MSLPWFRMYAEAVDNDKLRLLAFEDRWHYVALLCCKAQGLLDVDSALRDRRIAVKLGVQVRELDEVLRRLSEVDLIDPQTLEPVGWSERQFRSDTDPTNAERQKRWRERNKKNKDIEEQRVTRPLRNGHITRRDTDTDTDTDTEKNPPNPPKGERRQKAKPDLPSNIDSDLWQAYREHRRRLRAPMTDRAEQLALSKLAKMDGSPNAIIEQSIERGWKGLFPVDGEQQRKDSTRQAFQ